MLIIFILVIITIITSFSVTHLNFYYFNMIPYEHRTYYLNSDMVAAKDTQSTKYKKVLRLTSFDEDYTDVSLKDAVIPNSFPTIQEETNDYFYYVLTLVVNADYQKSYVFQKDSMVISVKIPEGFYTQDQIIEIMNQNLINIKLKDFLPRNENDLLTQEDLDMNMFVGDSIFELDNKDDNQTNHLQINCKTNVLYSPALQSDHYSQPICWIGKLQIFTRDLAYKYFGISKDGYYDCFNIEHNTYFRPGNIKGIIPNKWLELSLPLVIFPFRPTIIWVNSITIRMDIVNIEKDSHVLDSIPVTNPELPFITYQNYDIFNTSKKFNNTYNNGQISIQITQQNGYELNLDNIEFCLSIVVFKRN